MDALLSLQPFQLLLVVLALVGIVVVGRGLYRLAVAGCKIVPTLETTVFTRPLKKFVANLPLILVGTAFMVCVWGVIGYWCTSGSGHSETFRWLSRALFVTWWIPGAAIEAAVDLLPARFRDRIEGGLTALSVLGICSAVAVACLFHGVAFFGAGIAGAVVLVLLLAAALCMF